MKLKKLTRKDFVKLMEAYSEFTEQDFKTDAKEFIKYTARTKNGGFYVLKNLQTGTTATIMPCCGKISIRITYSGFDIITEIPIENLIETGFIIE